VGKESLFLFVTLIHTIRYHTYMVGINNLLCSSLLQISTKKMKSMWTDCRAKSYYYHHSTATCIPAGRELQFLQPCRTTANSKNRLISRLQ
jgi:hypothetical protein